MGMHVRMLHDICLNLEEACLVECVREVNNVLGGFNLIVCKEREKLWVGIKGERS